MNEYANGKPALPGGAEVAALIAELRQLYDEIGDCLDDDRIEEWPNYFTEDCEYRVISKENFDQGLPQSAVYCDGIAMVRDRVLAHREAQVFEPRALRHFTSGVRVLALGKDGLEARANFMLTEAMSDEAPRLLMVGRYLDRFVRRGDRLLLQRHQVVYDNHSVFRSIVVPV
jgi:anthranilate 1,2-dioxygenase small subunit